MQSGRNVWLTARQKIRCKLGNAVSIIDNSTAKLLSKCDELTHANATGIFHAVQQISEKSGIKVPKIYRLKANLGPILDNFPAGALQHRGENVLLLGHSINGKVFGVDYTQASTISDEFKAILAHEMGHLYRKDTKFPTGAIWRSNLSPLACMVGAIAGTYAVRSYLEKKVTPSIESNEKTPEELASAAGVTNAHKGTVFEAIGKVAIYTAMAMLGFAGGMLMLRNIRQNMEFSCDAFSKKVMGSGEPLARALEKFHSHAQELSANQLGHLPAEKQAMAKKVISFLESFMHPPVEQRIKALRQ